MLGHLRANSPWCPLRLDHVALESGAAWILEDQRPDAACIRRWGALEVMCHKLLAVRAAGAAHINLKGQRAHIPFLTGQSYSLCMHQTHSKATRTCGSQLMFDVARSHDEGTWHGSMLHRHYIKVKTPSQEATDCQQEGRERLADGPACDACVLRPGSLQSGLAG